MYANIHQGEGIIGAISKIKELFARPRQRAMVGLPRVVPRRSRDEDALNTPAFRESYTIPATFPFGLYDVINYVAVTDPYVSKFVQTTVSLGMGSGHNLYVRADSEDRANEAIDCANQFAQRVSPFGGGLQGIQCALLKQLALTAACCVEWTPNRSISEISRGFLVPIKSLRFRYADNAGTLELVQSQQGKLVPLNPIQTVYHALVLKDDSPYPVPPIASALEACEIHKNINRQIKSWMEKISGLGVLLASVDAPPRESGETQAEYDAKAGAYLEAISDTITNNLNHGIGIGYDNIKFTFQNTQSSAQGAKDILQVVLQGMFAGLQRHPIFFGWEFSSGSEGLSKVVYEEMLRNLTLYQLGVKKCLEHGHRLNMAFSGMGDIGVEIEYNNDFLKDVFKESEARQMLTQAVVMQVEAGLATPEEGRKILGLDDRTVTSGAYTASFSQQKGRYSLNPYSTTQWNGFSDEATITELDLK